MEIRKEEARRPDDVQKTEESSQSGIGGLQILGYHVASDPSKSPDGCGEDAVRYERGVRRFLLLALGSDRSKPKRVIVMNGKPIATDGNSTLETIRAEIQLPGPWPTIAGEEKS